MSTVGRAGGKRYQPITAKITHHGNVVQVPGTVHGSFVMIVSPGESLSAETSVRRALMCWAVSP